MPAVSQNGNKISEQRRKKERIGTDTLMKIILGTIRYGFKITTNNMLRRHMKRWGISPVNYNL